MFIASMSSYVVWRKFFWWSKIIYFYDAMRVLCNRNFRWGCVHALPITIELVTQYVDRFKIPPAFYTYHLLKTFFQISQNAKVCTMTVKNINALKPMMGQARQNASDYTLVNRRCKRHSSWKAHIKRCWRIANFWSDNCTAALSRSPSNFPRTNRICSNQSQWPMLLNGSGWQYYTSRLLEICLHFIPRHFFKFHENVMTLKLKKRKVQYELACIA